MELALVTHSGLQVMAAGIRVQSSHLHQGVACCAKFFRKNLGAQFATLPVSKKRHNSQNLKVFIRGRDFAKFIKPSELTHWIRQAELDCNDMTGLLYNPLSGHYRLAPGNVDVNYMVSCSKENNVQ